MSKIGIVLSGGMSKGAYEIGCLKAISEYFGYHSIRCVSASSIGVLTGYAFSCKELNSFEEAWKELDTNQSRKIMLKMSRDDKIIEQIKHLVHLKDQFLCETYSTVWNYSKRQAESIDLSKQDFTLRKNYLLASIAIPIINKGILINDDIYFDGAFLDNIPVYPLLEKDLDYIFCIYFDGLNYMFENHEFDKKVIKLNSFPDKSRFDFILYDPNKVDEMIKYAYDYTKGIIEKIFISDVKEEIYKQISNQNSQKHARITSDVILNNLNKITIQLSKRKNL